MFGMDMAFGGGMMDMGAMDMGIGAMDMGIGAMDMAMGRPLLGAEMIGMGAMDMRMGAMEMNMGMGMMDRGMMGMGMGGYGMGYGMMGGGMGICAPGCMLACCRPVVVCPPGCMRSCCVNQQVIVRNVPNQYNNNSGFVQLPPIQQSQRPQNYPQAQQPRQYEVTPNDGDIQQQMMSQQVRLERQKNDQLLYRQRLQQEKLQLQREKFQFEQKQIEQQRNEQMRLQQAQEQQRYQQIRLQQKMGTLPQYKTERQPSFAIDQNRIKANPYGIEIIYEGNIYFKNTQFAQWMQVKAQLTMNAFQECNIDGLNKIKIKNTRHGPNFRVIKLSFLGRADMFIAVPHQEQSEWMCRIIWTRLNNMNRPFNQNQMVNFNQNPNGKVYYEGEIIRKSFFNGWEPKYACVSASGLIISNNKGGEITHHIKSVPQIWTRFDFVQGNMLIIKFHAMGRKNEIGIPVEHGMPWLKALYTLTLP